MQNGKISKKCFEVAKRRRFHKLKDAMKLFKALYNNWNCVYIFETQQGFMVEFKTYVESYDEALDLRNKVEAILEVLESEN